MRNGEKEINLALRRSLKIVVIVLVILFIVLILVIQLFPHYLPLGITKHSPQYYLDGKYKEYSGGRIAAEFFPDSEELGNYRSLDFYYVNNLLRFSVFHGRYGNTFRLDVDYSEQGFEKAVFGLLSSYGCNALYNKNELELMWYRDYYTIEFKPGAFDDEEYFYLCISEKDHRIRFLFMEGSSINSTLRMVSDFDMSIWGAGLEVYEPTYAEAVKQKYDSYIIQ